ncbi:MAG TPA: M28 family peptidase [Bryobacteraceae bacterium]|nr:M28 family peptidase [Bryobacteraceae bacterium]
MIKSTALLLLALPICFGAEPGVEKVLDEVRAGVKPDQAMDYMRRVYSTDRWFTFPKFQQTAEYLKEAMTDAGLQKVELLGAPADGVTQVGYWTEPMAWDAKQARLELIGEDVPEQFRVLADYEKVPTSLGMWSGPTPAGGITAEIVEWNEKSDVRGKLVLTRQNPANIKWDLVKKGVVGAINTFTENPELQDGRQWVNAWGDNGWAFTKGSTPLICFSITPRQAAFVRKLLAEGRTVRAHALVDTRYYAGVYPYVTGVIPGAGSEEEVLTLGHSSEQGAQDNATGVAAMLESLASLNRLIAQQKLPRPKRTIRVLLMGEMYGSMHYMSTHMDRARRTVAAMCVDTPAAPYNLAGTEYTFYMNPHSSKSYTDAFVLHVAELYLPKVGRPWHWHEFMSGTDTYLAEPTVGIPTVWPYSGTGIVSHHNSEDKADQVDSRSLRDLAILNATYLYYLANAGEPEAAWLAELAANRGYEQILSAAAQAIDRAFDARSGEELGRAVAQGIDKINYAVDRESQSVLSVARLVPEARQGALRIEITPLAKRLEGYGQQQSARLQDAANRRAAQIGLSQPVELRIEADPQMSDAARIVVKRKRFGTIPLDDIHPDDREGFPSGAWDGTVIAALYWCDGHRNLAEVIRLTRLELGADKFDFVGYFKFLERRGYVEFVTPGH